MVGRRLAVRGLLSAACVGVLAASIAGVAGARSPLVTATVTRGQTVAQLRYQLFTQKLECTASCDATTIVFIKFDDARRLGFAGTSPPHGRVMVASNFTRVKPNALMETRFVVNAQGKRLLARARSGLHVYGLVTAFPRGKPNLAENVTWETTLK